VLVYTSINVCTVNEFYLQQGMGSPRSTVEAARRRLRDLVRRGDKLGLTRSDLVSLPAARLLTSSGSRWRWRSTSLAITALAVILAITAVLTKCYVHYQATTSFTSGVSAASLDPWWQQQQLQRLVSVMFVSFNVCVSSILARYCYIILCVATIRWKLGRIHCLELMSQGCVGLFPDICVRYASSARERTQKHPLSYATYTI
jgi:hypothetical protein